MAWVRSPFVRFCAAMVASMLVVLALAWGLRLGGYRLSAVGLSAVLLGWAAVISLVVVRYWRLIDEAAREAQKSAWLWGGLIGMCLALVGLKLNPLGVVDLIVPAGLDRASLLNRGAWILAFAQLAGFLLTWAFWWWRRR